MSHPNAALFAAYSSGLVFLFFGRERQTLIRGVLAAAGAVVVALPWLVVTVGRHGLAPFLTAMQSSNPGSSPLELLITLRLTQEAVGPVLLAVAAVGVLVCARDRNWWLPTWLLAACLFDTRYQGTFAMVPIALLVGVAVGALAEVQRSGSGSFLSRNALRIGAIAAVAVVAVASVVGTLRPDGGLQALPDSTLDAMVWVAATTPPEATFVVVAPAGVSAGSESEWFPQVAGRQSLGTYQGREWLEQDPGPAAWERYNRLQACGASNVACLNSWAEDAGESFDYVFVRAAGTDHLRESLDASPEFDVVYEGPDVWIYARDPEAPTDGPAAPADGYLILAAGDIAACDSTGDEATASLVDELIPEEAASVVVLGDLAYENGSADDFARCYEPSWGRFRDRTLPTPGNHEYNTPDAAAYFDYFADETVGEPDAGWYVTERPGWRLIALNSNCDEVSGCGRGSRQWSFLTDQLRATDPGDCVLAFWHHPRWSSGDEHGSDDQTDALWRALADAGADLLLTGHDHTYERFVPMDADGAPDPAGMTQFVVGTGGRSLYGFGEILPTSAAHDSSTYGVLQLTLREGAYDWAFVPTEDGGFTDSGSASCD
jgi:hypothetical protein